tara:strand:+ start:6629 stop:9022 length:2394 start_codon:yes stop_codon:yes gene_type:complete
MGWRAAKASGNASMPVDTGGSFAQGFASSFVPLVTSAAQSYADEQKEKRMLELKESLYRQRPVKSSTAASDRKDKEDLREITSLANELGVTTTEAASLYYAHDGDASMAADRYNSDAKSGVLVGDIIPSSPKQDGVIPDPLSPDTTDDLSQTEPTAPTEKPVVGAVEAAPEEDVVMSDALGIAPKEPAFESFDVASLGTITEDLALLTEGDNTGAVEAAAAAIDEVIEVADASGQVPQVTYDAIQETGATTQETRSILKAGTRLSQVYAIPEPAAIKSVQEAQAAMDVLNARSEAIGGVDTYDRDMRPILEARIRSLTELPDLGAMLQNNERDKLQEFYENGFRQYENVTDPAQLQAHRERAGVLLSQANSMPEIPQTLPELRALQTRMKTGEFTGVPTEWKAALNTATRTAELQDRYGERLTPEWLFDPAREVSELQGLQSAVSSVLGTDSLVLADINAAITTKNGNPDLVEIADITKDNYIQAAEDAKMKGQSEYATRVMELGARLVEADRDDDVEAVASMAELGKVTARFQAEDVKVGEQARGYLGAVDAAYSLSRILEENPDILRVAGGALPATIKGAVGEISALTTLLGSPDAKMDGAAALRSVDAYERRVNDAFGSGKLDAAARAYAMFQAQETRLAFQVARMQQGPAGVISNQDFDSALRSVRASRDPNTWADSIRGLIIRDEVGVQSAIRDFGNLSNVKLAVQMQDKLGLNDIVSVAPLEQRIQDAGLNEAYQWIKSGNPLIPVDAPTDTAPAIPQGAIDMLKANPDLRDAFEEKYGVSADSYLGEQDG